MNQTGQTHTEQRSQSSVGFDLLSDAEALRRLWEGQKSAIGAVEAALPAIAEAARAVSLLLGNGQGRLVYAGAGASGLLALQDGMELLPTFGWPWTRVLLLLAGGDQARFAPDGASEDDVSAAQNDLENHDVGPADAIIAVAASGATPYTVEILRGGRKRGALCVGIANNPNTPLLTCADCPILVETGPEVIAGSTRLGAGTAQKAVLGIMSSMIMTRLGHVVDGLMVSVVANNSKLQERATTIVAQLAGTDRAKARACLEQTGQHVKLAVLVASGKELGSAKEMLSNTGGDLRKALESVRNSDHVG